MLVIGGSESQFSGCFQIFAPKFRKMVGPLNAGLVVGTLRGGGDTQTLPAVIKM